MARTIKRTNPGDVANIFVRCMLSDISEMLGGFTQFDLERTIEYFDYKCPYTGEDISVEYNTGKYVLDHLIPHNRDSAGLHLFGNIIITTKETNSAKAAKAFDEFIRYQTEGTDEEKEKRIQKIRNFQQESDYFKKIKNIDEIKELCQKEYDCVQSRLREHFSKYEIILGKKNENLETRPKRIFVANSFKQKTEPKTSLYNYSKITKSEAINLFMGRGFYIRRNITFASENKSSSKHFWANPNVRYLRDDWWLILNDISKRTLHLFFIPANSINSNSMYLRSDKPDLIDMQINYNDKTFTDSRSYISFENWLKDSIKY